MNEDNQKVAIVGCGQQQSIGRAMRKGMGEEVLIKSVDVLSGHIEKNAGIPKGVMVSNTIQAMAALGSVGGNWANRHHMRSDAYVRHSVSRPKKAKSFGKNKRKKK